MAYFDLGKLNLTLANVPKVELTSFGDN